MHAFLRDAHWLNARRARAYAMMLALAFLAMLTVNYLAIYKDGTDFQAFWSAARILADQGPAAAFDLDLQRAVQKQAGFDAMIAYVNPPPFLFFVFWLALLPFGAAWIAWTAVTFAIWFGAMHREYRGDLTWPLLAFPAAFLAAAHAQNGFVTGALLAGAVLALRRSPWLAGVLLGMLVIKPHLALLAPFWLRMTTPYAALRYYATPEAAMVVQAAITLAMLALTMIFARRTRDSLASGALMLAATAVASPYLFSYDLPFLAVPVFWLIADGRARGWRPWEKLLVAGLYLAPLATRAAALPLEINLMPIPALAMVALIWNRGSIEGARVPGEWRPASEGRLAQPA